MSAAATEETDDEFFLRMDREGATAGRRLAGIVDPFVKHMRDLSAGYGWVDAGRLRLGVVMYSVAFVEAWWQSTR